MAVAEQSTEHDARAVLTPDFYDYAWDALASADIDGDFVELGWPDGTTLRAYGLWLRENAVGAGGIDVATREGLLDPASFVAGTHASAVALTSSGALVVDWAPENIRATYHPGWLRHVADGRHRASSWIPEPTTWTANELPEPPTHDGINVFEDDAVLREWVNDLLRWGIARLRNLPTDPDFGRLLSTRLGAVRDTNFGPIWDVKADIAMAGSADTNSTANTNLRLGPHTDLPTRETPPGFQFLHCIENTTEGGYSTMADGAAVAHHIETNRPDHYEALTTLRWIFFNRGPGIDHRWSGPIIDLGVAGSPLTFRAFYPVRGFPDMAESDIARAYEAMSYFSRVAADDRFQMRYPFRPGDLVGFDNRRILHGRDSYSSGGRRHLRGIYIDQDEIRSFARVANRRHVATNPPTSTPQSST